MVERPIKKSERQVSTEASGVAEKDLETEPNQAGDEQEQALNIETPSEGKHSPNQQDRKDRNKSSKKGRGDQQREQETSRVNPALLRGPKPTRPRPPVTHVEQATTPEAPVIDEEQDTPTDS
jgi:hypothetical protein